MDWLVGGLGVGWLVGALVDWLVDGFIIWLVGCLNGLGWTGSLVG